MPIFDRTKRTPFESKKPVRQYTFTGGETREELIAELTEFAMRHNSRINRPWHEKAQDYLKLVDGILPPFDGEIIEGEWERETRYLFRSLQASMDFWRDTQDPDHIFEAGRAFEALRIHLQSDYLADGRNHKRRIEADKLKRHRPILKAAHKVLAECPQARHKNGKPNGQRIADLLADNLQVYFGTDDPPLDYRRMLADVIRPAIKDGTLR